MIVISPQTRNTVWHTWLDAARLVRYYSELWNKQAKIRIILRIVLLVSAGGTLTAVIAAAPEVIQGIFAIIIGVIVAYDFAIDHSKRVATLKLVSQECGRLEEECHALWIDVERGVVEDAEVIEQVNTLTTQIREATDRAQQMEIPIDSDLHEKCTEQAYTITKSYDVPA